MFYKLVLLVIVQLYRLYQFHKIYLGKYNIKLIKRVIPTYIFFIDPATLGQERKHTFTYVMRIHLLLSCKLL